MNGNPPASRRFRDLVLLVAAIAALGASQIATAELALAGAKPKFERTKPHVNMPPPSGAQAVAPQPSQKPTTLTRQPPPPAADGPFTDVTRYEGRMRINY
jgi:hypothetical protein